jgi:hypothetical protein
MTQHQSTEDIAVESMLVRGNKKIRAWLAFVGAVLAAEDVAAIAKYDPFSTKFAAHCHCVHSMLHSASIFQACLLMKLNVSVRPPGQISEVNLRAVSGKHKTLILHREINTSGGRSNSDWPRTFCRVAREWP